MVLLRGNVFWNPQAPPTWASPPLKASPAGLLFCFDAVRRGAAEAVTARRVRRTAQAAMAIAVLAGVGFPRARAVGRISRRAVGPRQARAVGFPRPRIVSNRERKG